MTPVAVSQQQLFEDPYPVYARLRAEAPVVRVAELRMWLVTRWDDIATLEDPERFTAAVAGSALCRTIGENMLHSDGPAHLRLREAVAPILRPRALRGWAEQVVPELATGLLAGLAGTADLMSGYAEPLSVLTLARLLGVAHLPLDRLRGWFTGIGAGAANFVGDPAVQATADAASGDVDQALQPFLSRGQTPVGGSLLHLLLNQPGNTDRLTDAEVLGTVKLMVIGGMQEPRDLIGTALQVLVEQPEVQQRVRSDPRLVSRLLEECLRWNAPVGTITREARSDTQVGGVSIPRGDVVAGVLASANRDEAHWTDPDRFDLDRDQGPHLAFAVGAHTCIGAGLARLVARIAVEAVLEFFPVLEAAGRIEQRGWEFRGPVAVPVRLGSGSMAC